MISVKNLQIEGLLGPLSFEIARGGRLALLGPSGSGKSLTALAIMGLLPDTLKVQGSIELHGRAAMVFQEPMNALDPLMKVGKQLGYAGAEPAHALAEVDLDPGLADRYPHELSGGQRQRVLIAIAMAAHPQLLICDEPTTALDAATQDGILKLIDTITAQRGTALLFISHDVRAAATLCSTAARMEKGTITGIGPLKPPAPQPVSAPAAAAVGEPLIELDNVTKTYRGSDALRGVSLTVRRGERLGIVGGSGSGKTTLLKIIAGLSQPTSGSVRTHGRVHMVFQDPHSSLNPRLPIWKSVAEAKKGASRQEVAQMLAEVGITEGLDRYPHEFSGGQRQRISIARALLSKPDILLADEAVSALDDATREQVLGLIGRLVESYGLTLVFISHDLRVVQRVCSSVAVVYRGEVVESGDIWTKPQHEYTKRLVAAAQK